MIIFCCVARRVKPHVTQWRLSLVTHVRRRVEANPVGFQMYDHRSKKF